MRKLASALTIAVAAAAVPVLASAHQERPAAERPARIEHVERASTAPRHVERPVMERPVIERTVMEHPREIVEPVAAERPVIARQRVGEHPSHARTPVERPRVIEPVQPQVITVPRIVNAPHVTREPRRLETQPRFIREPRTVETQPRIVREPRSATAPRFVRVSQPARHATSFVQYYPRSIVSGDRNRVRLTHPRIAYIRRAFVRPVQVVRTYRIRPRYVTNVVSVPVGYVYRGYAPAYTAPVYTTYSAQYVPVAANWYSQYVPFYGYGSWNGAPWQIQNGYGGYYSGYDNNPQPYYGNAYPYPYNGGNAYPYPYNGNAYPYPNQGFAQPGFGSYVNPFGNAQIQGVVLSNMGGTLVVLTPNLTPVFVNLTPAQQMGYVNTSLQPGSLIQAYGYSSGNEFIATAIV